MPPPFACQNVLVLVRCSPPPTPDFADAASNAVVFTDVIGTVTVAGLVLAAASTRPFQFVSAGLDQNTPIQCVVSATGVTSLFTIRTSTPVMVQLVAKRGSMTRSEPVDAART